MAEGESLLPSTGPPVTQRGLSARSLGQSSESGSGKKQMGFFERIIHNSIMYETNEVVRLHWNHEIYNTEQGRKYKWAVRTSICTYFGVTALILLYIVYYYVYMKHGMQSRSAIYGSVQPKIFGSTQTKFGKFHDALDLIIPQRESSAFFVTTAYEVVNKQERGTCGEPRFKCSKDADCAKINPKRGVKTGKCTSGLCEVNSWCPILGSPEANSKTQVADLPGVLDFEVAVNVKGSFSTYNMQLSQSLKTTVGEICKKAGVDSNKAVNHGTLIFVDLTYDCNLDQIKDISQCKPSYAYRRIDDPDEDDPSMKGYTFRSPDYFWDGQKSQEVRDFYQRKGVRVVFSIGGYARRFSFVALAVTAGTTVALLSLAKTFTDALLDVIKVPANVLGGSSLVSFYDAFIVRDAFHYETDGQMEMEKAGKRDL